MIIYFPPVAVIFLICLHIAVGIADHREKTYSIFLIGDSTMNLQYIEGYKEAFNCNKEDPRTKRSFEVLNFGGVSHLGPGVYKTPGLVCDHPQVKRIGFLFNWGVSFTDNDYLNVWDQHRAAAGDLPNSPRNVIDAIREFQNRTGCFSEHGCSDISLETTDHEIVYLYLSNFWDARYYYDRWLGKPRSPPTHLTVEEWTHSFRKNYTQVVQSILKEFKHGDESTIPVDNRLGVKYHHLKPSSFAVRERLVLQTAHPHLEDWTYFVNLLNSEIISVGHSLNVPVFREDIHCMQDAYAEHPADWLKIVLRDGYHQNKRMSRLLVNKFADQFLSLDQ